MHVLLVLVLFPLYLPGSCILTADSKDKQTKGCVNLAKLIFKIKKKIGYWNYYIGILNLIRISRKPKFCI